MALDEIKQAVIDGNARAAHDLTSKALQQNTAPQEIFRGALVPAMDEVGRRMQALEYFIPEVLLSARAMRSASDVLKPIIAGRSDIQSSGKIIIGSVQGDLHDIGKNLVGMMLEGAGFEVSDLGIDVKAEVFVAKIQEIKPDVVALSAMITTTMMAMKATVETLEQAGVRQGVKVIIGGAPVTQRFADEIGADGYAADAAGAAELARKLTA